MRQVKVITTNGLLRHIPRDQQLYAEIVDDGDSEVIVEIGLLPLPITLSRHEVMTYVGAEKVEQQVSLGGAI